MTNPRNEELHATITARAELDRAYSRLLIEEASSVMAKNLTYLLDQTQQHSDEQEARFTAIVKDALSSLHSDNRTLETKLDTAIDDTHKRVDELEAHFTAELAQQSRERAGLSDRLTRIEASLAGRSELVAQHIAYEARIAALEEHEAARIKLRLGLGADE